MARPSTFALASLALLLAGCGGGGGGGSSATKSLTISAPNLTVAPGGTVAFVAHKDGGGTVKWSATGGTIDASGVFTAPATQGSYTVTATAGGLTASQAVTVTNGIAIALTANATPPLTIPKSKLSFTASVTGATDKTVTWSATDASGTAVDNLIAADGTFTAPATAGTYTVVGAAKADATKTAKATVQVAANANVRFSWKDKGDLLLTLRPDKAPNTAANLVTLVNKGFYDGIRIHRTATVADDGFAIIQWGDPLTKTLPLDDPRVGTGGPGYTIPFETNDLSNVQYSLGMARGSDKDSGGSQIYVNLSDNSGAFDPNYVVFGAVSLLTLNTANALALGDTITKASVEAVTP